MREASAALTRLNNGWVQAKVPLPFSLKWVNAYLLPNGKRWTIIDPGLRTEETEAFWTVTLSELGVDWPDIEAIVLTHYHPDHYGLAGWFQERTGAPVHMSGVSAAYARRLWGEDETFSEELIEAFQSHGFPDELLGGLRDHLSGVKKQVQPHPAEIRLLPEPGGQRFEMAGLTWEPIGGEGHAPGHRSFYQPESRIILCGDQVLPHITPNIGWLPGGDPDPLGSYLSSLERMLACEATLALPGHRDPFPDFRGRVEELIAHHDRRLKQIEKLLEEAGPMSGFELCDKLFGARISGNPHNHRFAMSETIAHAERLVFSGAVVRIGADGTETGMQAIPPFSSILSSLAPPPPSRMLTGRQLIRYRRA
ncbi:MBL fold metallo-hydrolase [Cohnella thailandensis]|uniref:MBL fold metallo-hydrolase n=1 Tax=Cohnella thailandensis TaxID=557557 RepID=A0A841STD8_9BACL|nr:MBL fold metallo-hydrolase [Cohnella thailandensis]MBB6633856.1 MBL fold metallo-hydrolase [Cohnella thailandensis]MBP1972539.1 glyoxylase-like metal-dependent hydrolase (beta-lactamase superfamily II) [Cohnella thailandensis]